jgi:hypothetical protein
VSCRAHTKTRTCTCALHCRPRKPSQPQRRPGSHATCAGQILRWGRVPTSSAPTTLSTAGALRPAHPQRPLHQRHAQRRPGSYSTIAGQMLLWGRVPTSSALTTLSTAGALRPARPQRLHQHPRQWPMVTAVAGGFGKMQCGAEDLTGARSRVKIKHGVRTHACLLQWRVRRRSP